MTNDVTTAQALEELALSCALGSKQKKVTMELLLHGTVTATKQQVTALYGKPMFDYIVGQGGVAYKSWQSLHLRLVQAGFALYYVGLPGPGTDTFQVFISHPDTHYATVTFSKK